MTDLLILEDCRKICFYVFDLCNQNPQYKYTLNQQIQRSAISIGSNIAEGCQRNGQDRIRFLNIALGSLEETRFQISLYNEYKRDIYDDIFEKIKATILRLRSRTRSRD